MKKSAYAIFILCTSGFCATAVAVNPAQPLVGEKQPVAAVSRNAAAGALALANTVSNPLSSLTNDRLLVSAQQVPARQGSAVAGLPEDEAGAGFGLMLASWAIVAFIAIRRFFG